MPKTYSFDLSDQLAEKLESFATEQGKPVNSLLVDIVTEYIEVTEFILRKKEVRNPKRRESKRTCG